MQKPGFVKSADTKTAVGNSRNEIEKILRRYGATGLQIGQDYAAHSATVSFIVPDSSMPGAQKVPVKLPVDITRVYSALYGAPRPKNGYGKLESSQLVYDPKKILQAERVAWRHLVLWIDAALSATTAGMQTITEAFFAHTVVGVDGSRMIEVVEKAQSQLGPGVQRLLTSTVVSE